MKPRYCLVDNLPEFRKNQVSAKLAILLLTEMNDPINTVIAEITRARTGAGTDDLHLRQLLTQGISWILQRQSQRLFQVLYRLDIPESKAEAIFRNFSQTEWPAELAKLIMEREKERQYWRKKYQSVSDSKPASEHQP